MKVKAVPTLRAQFSRHEMGLVMLALDAYAADRANGTAAQEARDMHTDLYRLVNGIDSNGDFFGPNYID